MKNESLTDRFGGLSGGHGPRRAGFSGGIFPCDAPIGKAELEPGCRTHEITVQAGGAEGGGGDDGRETGIITETRPKVKKPSMYKVLLLNDDYTPMEFVILILVRFFNKSEEDATRIMLHVHQRGVGVCGVYPFEVAETKVTQVVDFARKHQHPLQCTLEKD